MISTDKNENEYDHQSDSPMSSDFKRNYSPEKEQLHDTREFIINSSSNKEKRPLSSPYYKRDYDNPSPRGAKVHRSRLDRRHKSMDSSLFHSRSHEEDDSFVIIDQKKRGGKNNYGSTYTSYPSINKSTTDWPSNNLRDSKIAFRKSDDEGLTLNSFKGSFGDFINKTSVPRHEFEAVKGERELLRSKVQQLETDLDEANSKIKELEGFKMNTLKMNRSNKEITSESAEETKAWKNIALVSQANINALAELNNKTVNSFITSNKIKNELDKFTKSLYITNDHRVPVNALLQWSIGGDTLMRKSYDRSLVYERVIKDGARTKSLKAVPDPDMLNRAGVRHDDIKNFNLEK